MDTKTFMSDVELVNIYDEKGFAEFIKAMYEDRIRKGLYIDHLKTVIAGCVAVSQGQKVEGY